MPNKRISHIIMEQCKTLGITYKSCNPEYVYVAEDATKLGEYCQTILTLVDKIDIILAKHKISSEFRDKINKEISNLHTLEHDLINFAQKIIIEEKRKK